MRHLRRTKSTQLTGTLWRVMALAWVYFMLAQFSTIQKYFVVVEKKIISLNSLFAFSEIINC